MNIIRRVGSQLLLCRNKDFYGSRTLFTPDTLGVTAYIANRELELTYTSHPEEFRYEFRQKIDQTVPINILVDNLKRYLHLLTARNEDIETLWRALRLHKTQREQWQKKTQLDSRKDYTFGPVTMRALSYHDLPEYAIKFFDDANITQLFDQTTSYQILLDLLYDRRMCADVLLIHDEIRKRIEARNRHVPSAINAIVFATYYRLNTPSHDEFAYDLYKELKERGEHTKQFRKSIALVAAMRLKRHQPTESLDILSIYDDIDVNIRYVRTLAHTHLNQFDCVFRLLKMTIATTEKQQTPKIPDQLLEKIEKKIEESGRRKSQPGISGNTQGNKAAGPNSLQKFR